MLSVGEEMDEDDLDAELACLDDELDVRLLCTEKLVDLCTSSRGILLVDMTVLVISLSVLTMG